MAIIYQFWPTSMNCYQLI